MSFEALQSARIRRSISALTANQVTERIKYVVGYMKIISPKLARYTELKLERDLLRQRYQELTQPPLV